METANETVMEEIRALRAENAALRQQNALLQGVLDFSTDAMFVKDAEGRYRLLNAAGAAVVGMPPAEVIGKVDDQLFPAQSAQRFAQTDRAAMAGSAIETYEETVTAGRTTRIYQTMKGPYWDGQGQLMGVVGIARDITESKNLQEERDRLLSRLRLHIDRLPLAYIHMDEKFRVLDWNPAAERLFGYSKGEALGRICLDLVLSQPLDARVGEIVRRLSAGDMEAHSINENRTKDGRIRTCEWFNTPLVEPDGTLAGLISLAQDVTERIRVEAARARDAHLLANVKDSVIVTDMDGIVTYWNEGATQLFGWRADEMMGRPLLERVPEEFRPRMQAATRAIVDGNDFTGEWEDYRKDGSRIWIDSRVTRLKDSGGKPIGLMGVARDITDRKLAEQALRESEEQVRLLLHSTGEGIYGIDLDGRCTFCNASCLRLLGYTASEEILGQPMHQLIHHSKADRTPYPLTDCPILRAFCDGEGTHVENEVFWRADGTTVPVEYWSYPIRRGNQVVGAVVAFVDITARKHAEEELNTLNAALENAVEGIALLDIEGRYLSVNRAYAEMHGHAPETLLGMNWQATIDPRFIERSERDRGDFLSRGRAETEVIGVRADGSRFWKQVVVVPTVNGSGQAIGNYAFVKDVTERKDAEESLRKYAERLQELSHRVVQVQEEERRHLARELHDEIGQSLTAIEINLEALKRFSNPAALPHLEECIAIVNQAIQQVRHLSLDLRPSILDDLGLVAALRWYLGRQALRVGYQAVIATDPLETPLDPAVATTAFRVAQEALTNVARHAKAKQVRLSLRIRSEVLRLSVLDDGVGFLCANGARSMAPGEGIGLVGMRERASLLGGRLAIRSAPACGTEVRLMIPLNRSKAL